MSQIRSQSTATDKPSTVLEQDEEKPSRENMSAQQESGAPGESNSGQEAEKSKAAETLAELPSPAAAAPVPEAVQEAEKQAEKGASDGSERCASTLP